MVDQDTTDDKVRENRSRRWADRLGLALRKSRGRISLDNRGGYMIIDPYVNALVGGQRFDLTLEDVEGFLQDYEKKLAVESPAST